MWAWGHESPQKIQKLASLMVSDVQRLKQHYEGILAANGIDVGADLLPKFPLLESIAAIGDNGTFSNNCHRDLMRCFGRTSLQKPSPTNLAIKDTANTAGYRIDPWQYIMWPHELFSYIYHSYRDVWEARICPGADTLRQFWDEMHAVDNPLTKEDAVRERTDLHTKCIPITVHGDGTPVAGLGKSWSKLLNIWHWKSVLAPGRTLDVCFYIFAIYERMLSKVEEARTYTQLHRRLKWSFAALWKGRWPTEDENGKAYVKATDPTFPGIVAVIYNTPHL
jgi:hypothetical protein